MREEQSENSRKTTQTIQQSTLLLALVRTVMVSEGGKMEVEREREIKAVDTISVRSAKLMAVANMNSVNLGSTEETD